MRLPERLQLWACLAGYRSKPQPPVWSWSLLKGPFSQARGAVGAPACLCPALLLAPPSRAATTLMLL